MKPINRRRIIAHSIIIPFAALSFYGGVPILLNSISFFRNTDTYKAELYEKQSAALKSLSQGLAANNYTLFACSDSAKTVSEREECSKKAEEKNAVVGALYDKEISALNKEQKKLVDLSYMNTLTAIGGALISLIGVILVSFSVFVESKLFLERRAKKVAQTEGE